MQVARTLTAAVLTFSLAPLLQAQTVDAWAGTWKLNLRKSTYTLGPAPQSAVSRLEPDGERWKLSQDTVDAQGKSIDGNSNLGHDYGNAALTEADRWALIAYLKSL